MAHHDISPDHLSPQPKLFPPLACSLSSLYVKIIPLCSIRCLSAPLSCRLCKAWVSAYSPLCPQVLVYLEESRCLIDGGWMNLWITSFLCQVWYTAETQSILVSFFLSSFSPSPPSFLLALLSFYFILLWSPQLKVLIREPQGPNNSVLLCESVILTCDWLSISRCRSLVWLRNPRARAAWGDLHAESRWEGRVLICSHYS